MLTLSQSTRFNGLCAVGQRPATRLQTRSLARTRTGGVSVRAGFTLADVAPQVAATASEVANQANTLNPGSVSAPAWVVPVALVVVTIGATASGYLLKPGADAAEKVFERDAKRLGKLGNKAKSKAKAVTKGRR